MSAPQSLDDLPAALAAANQPALEPSSLDGLREFWAWLEDANSRTNLTRIQGEADFAERHALDALLALSVLDACVAEATGPIRLVDVGSGCGVPGAPLAIARPSWQVTLLESASRKARCLAELEPRFAGRLQVCAERAELAGRDEALRDQADLVVARAVGSVPLVLELTLPLVRPGGHAVLYRGPHDPTELAEVARVAPQLGASPTASVHEATLPSGAARSFLVVRKESPTPDRYPRRPGVPGKRPL